MLDIGVGVGRAQKQVSRALLIQSGTDTNNQHQLPAVTSDPIESALLQPHAWRMTAFLLWLLLFVFCWPLALLALVLYPLVWLLLLPFRLLGFAVEGVFGFLHALLMLPARALRGPRG